MNDFAEEWMICDYKDGQNRRANNGIPDQPEGRFHFRCEICIKDPKGGIDQGGEDEGKPDDRQGGVEVFVVIFFFKFGLGFTEAKCQGVQLYLFRFRDVCFPLIVSLLHNQFILT